MPMHDDDLLPDESSLHIIGDLRWTLADKSRLLLNLPSRRSNIEDIEVDTVLMYLSYCADYFIQDSHLSKAGEYAADVALHDLDLLAQAIAKVRKQIKIGEQNGRRPTARVIQITQAQQKKAAKEGKQALFSADPKQTLLDESDFIEHFSQEKKPTKPDVKPTAFIVGRKKEEPCPNPKS